MDQFWTWAKLDLRNAARETIIGAYHCTYFEKELCFKLGKSMCRNHRSVFQFHVKDMHNDVMRPVIVGILHYADCVHYIHDLAKYLPHI